MVFSVKKQTKKHYLPCLFFGKHFFFLVEQTFFFAWPKRKKKDLLVLVGITFFSVWFSKPLQTVPPQNSGHHLITFFEGHLIVFKIHHYGLMWIICLHNISRTTSWNIFLLCGCFFGSFLGLNYIYQWSSQFSKLTTWGQCELFVCTISQEPLDEIFSYLVVASSEVSWDAHTGNTPQALTMAWSCPNVPLCGNLGEVEYQIP